jgi:hypothetical protein
VSVVWEERKEPNVNLLVEAKTITSFTLHYFLAALVECSAFVGCGRENRSFQPSKPATCSVVLLPKSEHSSFIGAPIIPGRCPLSAHESESMLRTYIACREKQREREREGERERERNKLTARGSSTQCTSNSDPISSTPELLLRQNSVTTHAHQS